MNNKHIEVIASYGMYCLDRQKKVLTAYRQMRSERLELVVVILIILVAIAGAITSIVCAAIKLLDGWAAIIVFVLAGITTGLFVVYAKATSDSITAHKQFIAESSDVNNTLSDISDVLNLLNDTEEEQQ